MFLSLNILIRKITFISRKNLTALSSEVTQMFLPPLKDILLFKSRVLPLKVLFVLCMSDPFRCCTEKTILCTGWKRFP